MESRTETLLAAIAGVVGIALTLVGGAMAGEFDDPLGSDSAAIIEFFQGATLDGVFVSGVLLETLGFLLLMAFVAKVAYAVGGHANRARWTGRVILTSMVVATVLTVVSVVGLLAATYRAEQGGLAGDGFVVLADVRFAAYWLSLLAWGLVYLLGGVAIVRLRSYPLWLGWAAAIIGAVHIVAPFIDPSTWDVATGLGGLWLLVTAVYMLVRADRYSQPAGDGIDLPPQATAP